MAKKQLTKEEAIAQLWEMGELRFLLTSVQLDMLDRIENDTTRTSVILSSRRLGKTYTLVTLALMQCLKKPNSIVKFLLPKQKDAKTIIEPLMREITETCPAHLRPTYNTQDKSYKFEHNGSEIHLGGSDLSAESLRGTKAHLVLIDEAGFVSDLLYSIRSILSPTIRTTRGRMIMASTPSRDPQHEFIQHFVNPYRAQNRLKVYTIYDNPNFTPEIIEEIISEYPRGVDDPDFKREYLCEITVDEEATICPEFSKHKAQIVYDQDRSFDKHPWTHFYVSADIGHRDLTVALFGYYNFEESCLYVEDELVMNGPTLTTDKLAKGIAHKESLNFKVNSEVIKPYRRVMDVNLAMQQDLNLLHDIHFITTRKDNREAAINVMRMWAASGRLKIHKRCEHLIYHLEFGQWNEARTDFKRLPDTPDKKIKGGHVDGIPALYYLIRNINVNTNPNPSLEGRRMMAMTPKNQQKPENPMSDILKKIVGIK